MRIELSSYNGVTGEYRVNSSHDGSLVISGTEPDIQQFRALETAIRYAEGAAYRKATADAKQAISVALNKLGHA
jgi:hypothetical protein